MKILGEVVTILNKDYFLAKATEILELETKLKVVKKISISVNTSAQLGIKYIYIPKGKYKVIADQGNNIYLLTFLSKEITKTITKTPHDLLYGGLGFYKKEEVKEKVLEESAAPLDLSQSLEIQVEP